MDRLVKKVIEEAETIWINNRGQKDHARNWNNLHKEITQLKKWKN